MSLQQKINSLRTFSPSPKRNIQLAVKEAEQGINIRPRVVRRVNKFDSEALSGKSSMRDAFVSDENIKNHILLIEDLSKKVKNTKKSRVMGLVSPGKLRMKLQEGALWFKSMSPDQRRNYVFSPPRESQKISLRINRRYRRDSEFTEVPHKKAKC